MKNKEETLLKSEVKAELVRGIELWLKDSVKKNSEIGKFPFGSWQREDCRETGDRYFAMAHSLFFAGRDLGLLTYDEYPMFKPSDYTEKED